MQENILDGFKCKKIRDGSRKMCGWHTVDNCKIDIVNLK